jgi:hypothetical protein
MTRQEFDYIARAMAALEAGHYPEEDQRKMLQTVSEITGRAAEKVQHKIEDAEVA